MTEKLSKNPYTRAGQIASKASAIALDVVLIAILIAVFGVYPVFALVKGAPLVVALGPWLGMGLVAIIVALLYVATSLWYKYSTEPWRKRSWEWERKRRVELNLDPQPYVWVGNDEFRYAVDEPMTEFKPRPEFNQNEDDYR